MNKLMRFLVVSTFGLSTLLAVVILRQSVVTAQDGWHDTNRAAKGTSRPTKNNDTVYYSPQCPAASDDGKWCADVVEVVVEIGHDDPEELYRLKYFQETPENCRKHVRIQSGPNGWASTIDCHFDPSLRRFVLHEKGWTKPQVFVSEITIQERDRDKK